MEIRKSEFVANTQLLCGIYVNANLCCSLLDRKAKISSSLFLFDKGHVTLLNGESLETTSDVRLLDLLEIGNLFQKLKKIMKIIFNNLPFHDLVRNVFSKKTKVQEET